MPRITRNFPKHICEKYQNLMSLEYSKTCQKRPLKRTPKIGFQYRSSLNRGQKYCRMLQGEHSAILWTFIKLQFPIKSLVMSIFKWPLKTDLTVVILEQSSNLANSSSIHQCWSVAWCLMVPNFSVICQNHRRVSKPSWV